jgi:hypothetical protein
MNGRQVQAVEEVRFGGVDWSWERHAVCVVDAAGTVIERFEAEHQAADLQAMVRRRRRAGALRVASSAATDRSWTRSWTWSWSPAGR